MAFARIYGAQNHALKADMVSIEIDLSKGLHAFSIVGLPNKAVEESRDRVSAAIKNSGFKSPKQTNAKVTVSLAPADLKKEGPAFDLPIAIGYLLASGNIDFDSEGKLFAGELALDGKVMPIRGILSCAEIALKKGIKELYVPEENAGEAALLGGIDVFGVSNLLQLARHLDTTRGSGPNEEGILKKPRTKVIPATNPVDGINLDDISGQEAAKRGLVIAAAGGHNIALFGPPGTGKTMLARAFQSILPPLSFEEMLEVTSIHSASGHLQGSMVTLPPVRNPHHTSSHTALVGGGSPPRPGEVTLAHRGVLFLDEFTEFDAKSLEALRQPIEERAVSISRARGSHRFPAHFILVAAFNPCPCGHAHVRAKACSCTPKDRARYARKLSGPIIDRIDMWIEVSRVDHDRLLISKTSNPETSGAIKKVLAARKIQGVRFGTSKSRLNGDISVRDHIESLRLSKEGEGMLRKAATTYDLSGRRYHRIIRLARTIADVEGSEYIEAPHILEALQYRRKSG